MNLVGSGRFVPSHACFSSVLYVLGKVAIQKEDLQKYHNRDTWFQLQHVDADSEVQVRPPLEPMEHWRPLGVGETMWLRKINRVLVLTETDGYHIVSSYL